MYIMHVVAEKLEWLMVHVNSVVLTKNLMQARENVSQLHVRITELQWLMVHVNSVLITKNLIQAIEDVSQLHVGKINKC